MDSKIKQIDLLDVKRLSPEEREIALSFTGSFHDAILTRNSHLLRGLISIRGVHSLSRSVALIHHAVSEGSIDCVDLLIHAGVEVDSIDTVYSRVTPLMEAVRKRNLNMVLFLLERGADIRKVDQCGDNIFHWAARYTNAVFLKKMIKMIKQVHNLIQYDEDGNEIIPASPRSPRSLGSGEETSTLTKASSEDDKGKAKEKENGHGKEAENNKDKEKGKIKQGKIKKNKKRKGMLKHEDELRIIVHTKNSKAKSPSEVATSSFVAKYLETYTAPIVGNGKGKKNGKVSLARSPHLLKGKYDS